MAIAICGGTSFPARATASRKRRPTGRRCVMPRFRAKPNSFRCRSIESKLPSAILAMTRIAGRADAIQGLRQTVALERMRNRCTQALRIFRERRVRRLGAVDRRLYVVSETMQSLQGALGCGIAAVRARSIVQEARIVLHHIHQAARIGVAL